MTATLAHITRERLWQKIETGDDFVLVDALAPMSFAASHLPGAVNMPFGRVDDLAPRRIPGVDTEVVVYCASSTCDSSVEVANRLLDLGYRHVFHYVGGKSDWLEAGRPASRGRPRLTRIFVGGAVAPPTKISFATRAARPASPAPLSSYPRART